jgi:hypothetical protein
MKISITFELGKEDEVIALMNALKGAELEKKRTKELLLKVSYYDANSIVLIENNVSAKQAGLIMACGERVVKNLMKKDIQVDYKPRHSRLRYRLETIK